VPPLSYFVLVLCSLALRNLKRSLNVFWCQVLGLEAQVLVNNTAFKPPALAVKSSYTDDTCSRNRCHKSSSFFWWGFWHMCHANLVPDSTGTRFWNKLEHGSIPSQKLVCTRLRNTAQKYIINLVHKSKFLVFVQCNAQHWTEYKITFMRLLLVPEIFIPGEYGTKTLSETRTRKWSWFMVPVYGLSVTGITITNQYITTQW